MMIRLRMLNQGEGIVIPASWGADDGTVDEHAVVLLIFKERVDSDCNYSITVINTGVESYKGLHYHPVAVDPTTGITQRSLSIELVNVPNEKILNTTFWYVHLL